VISAPLYGLILGGGRSRRMGIDKATLQYHGRSQLEIAFELLAPFCEKTFVGIREDQSQQPVFAAHPQLFDKYPGEGPLAAVVSAQEQYPHAAWWVLACDLPFLDTETLAFLLKQRNSGRRATAFLSHHDGRIEPLCAIYEPSSSPTLHAQFTEGLRCARRGLESVEPVALTLPHRLALENANTPAERDAVLADLGKPLPPKTEPAKKKSTRVNVHLYAQLREKLGKVLEVDLLLPSSENEVLEQVASLFPDMKPLILRCRIAVDDSYLTSEAILDNVKVMDMIAPVSGG
jgi:molybdenum cofactor guanylyltransferase